MKSPQLKRVSRCCRATTLKLRSEKKKNNLQEEGISERPDRRMGPEALVHLVDELVVAAVVGIEADYGVVQEKGQARHEEGQQENEPGEIEDGMPFQVACHAAFRRQMMPQF